MKSLLKDESADSMMIFVIVTGVIIFGFTFIALSSSHNAPITAINEMIDNGMISKDTITHFNTMNQMWQASPFFFVVGLVLWLFERAKGESVTSDMFLGYLMLMIVTLVMSMYFVWGFGLSLDSIILEFENNSMLMNYGPEWDVTGARQVLITGVYYAAMLPGFIGSILFMLHPIMRQRENTFLDNPKESGNGEYITDYSLNQM